MSKLLFLVRIYRGFLLKRASFLLSKLVHSFFGDSAKTASKTKREEIPPDRRLPFVRLRIIVEKTFKFGFNEFEDKT